MEYPTREERSSKLAELKGRQDQLFSEIMGIVNEYQEPAINTLGEAEKVIELMFAFGESTKNEWEDKHKIQYYLNAEKRGDNLDVTSMEFLKGYRRAMQYVERQQRPQKLLEEYRQNEKKIQLEEKALAANRHTPKKDENSNCEILLFERFPTFKKHSKFLKNKGFYTVDAKNLCWKHGGNLLLAGYFGMIQDKPGITRFVWSDIERAFSTKNLAQYYREYDTMRKGKTEKYANYDKTLRDLIDGRICL